jgi:hypothetical protein
MLPQPTTPAESNDTRWLKMQSVHIAQWDGKDGRTYSTLGLGVDGYVYRYDVGCNGWIRYSMLPATCGISGHKR